MADKSQSSSSNKPDQPEIPGLDPNAAPPAAQPGPQAAVPAPQPAAAPEKPAPKGSLALGNLVLLIILGCLISIPFLIYFTDTPARFRRNVDQLEKALHGDEPKVIEKIVEKKVIVEVPVEVPVPAPAKEEPKEEVIPDPDPVAPVPRVLPRQEYEVSSLTNGLNIKATLDLQKGSLASKERVEDGAYEFEIKLKIRVPEANDSLDTLSKLNPALPKILPGLEPMLKTAKVSPFYAKLYDEKHKRIKANASRLDLIETRHNYFDCESILELTHPETGQKTLLMQGEMDVVADGSDGDRMPVLDEYISLSSNYQATTSYGWSKKTKTPNPLLSRFEDALKKYQEEYKIKGLSNERNRFLEGQIAYLPRLITDLKSRSFLIAEADPFIVLPLSLLGEKGSHAPNIGDYAAIVYGDKVYPAICGDAGPRWKMGEASLFVAKTLSDKASPYNRPVSDLEVTYLVFPGSREETKGPPNLDQWSAKCQTLLDRVGGLGEDYSLYDWRDVIAERKAVRELKKLASDLADLEKSASTAAAGAKKAVAAVKTKATEAGKALQDAKAASSAESDIEALQTKANDAAAAAEKAAKLATDADAAAKRITAAAKSVKKAAGTAEKAVALPLTEPKAKTTDVALAALAEGDAAFKSATADAQLALKAESEIEALTP